MELTSNELKTQAKILLKALKVNDFLATKMQKSLDKFAMRPLDYLQLKHCLTPVSHQLGFTNWYHAQLYYLPIKNGRTDQHEDIFLPK